MSTSHHPKHAVPTGLGTAMPKTPQELMKMIHAQKRRENKKNADNMENLAVSISSNKQELQSEILETKLMELEDYTSKPEGVHRLLRTFEIITMETEDDLSLQSALHDRKEQAKVELREQLRKEVEARKLQEQKEREERKIAAEKRRAAVVERLRLQAEAEERRKQEAIDALIRLENEKQRAIQYEINRLLGDQSQISIEDELSALIESDFREQQKRILWQQQEKEKLIEWEKAQKIKDQADDIARQARMKEMDERKQKLIKLKEQQKAQLGANSNNNTNTNAINAKAEADKLNKQLRIQNKAKFVSKRIQVAQQQKADDETNVVSVHVCDNAAALDSLNLGSTTVALLSPPPAAAVEVTTVTGIDNTKPDLVVTHSKFVEEIGNITDEMTLKDMQNELMAEKRSLRLELRSDTQSDNVSTKKQSTVGFAAVSNLLQATSTSGVLTGSGSAPLLPSSAVSLLNTGPTVQTTVTFAGTPLTAATVISKAVESHNNAIKERIEEITFKETIISQRLESLLQNRAQITNSTHGSEFDADVMVPKRSSNSLSESKPPGGLLTVSSQNVLGSSHNQASAGGVSTNTNTLFKQAESLLREGNQLLTWLTAYHASLQPRYTPSSSTPTDLNATTLATNTRRITIIVMEMGQLSRTLTKDKIFDPIGYTEKLNSTSADLKRTLQMVNDALAAALVALEVKTSTNGLQTTVNLEAGEVTNPAAVSAVTAAIGRDWLNISHAVNPIPQPTVLTNSAVAEKPKEELVLTSHSEPLSPSSNAAQQQHQQQALQQQTLIKSATTSTIPPQNSDKPQNTIVTSTSAADLEASNVKEVKAEMSTVPGQEGVKLIEESTASETPPPAPQEGLTSTSHTDIQKEAEGAAGAEEEVEGQEDTDTDSVSFSDIPGWDDCINTSMYTAAHHAAFYGYLQVLETLSQYFDCFSLDTKHRTPLFYASLSNQLDCVAFLVGLNPEWIDVGDEKGDTPLHAAAIANGIETLRFLLSCEANPDTANYNGLTPAHLARTHASLIVLHEHKALLYCVDSKSRMPLWFACSDGRDDCVAFLCTVTPVEYILWPDDEGETCLHKAAANGHYKCVEVLCSHFKTNKDLYTLNRKGHTAAHVAANAAVLKVLYENGMNLYVTDSKQRNPLFFASFFGRVDCVIFLIEIAFTAQKQKQAQQQPKTSTTIVAYDGTLIASSGTGSPSVAVGSAVKAVLQLSPRLQPQVEVQHQSVPSDVAVDGLSTTLTVPECIKHKDIQGDTALHAACLCGNIQCVNILCFYLLNTPNNQQITPEQLAIKANHIHIAKLVAYYETQRSLRQSNGIITDHNKIMCEMYGTDFATLTSMVLYYGSRWTLGFDHTFNACYYIDHCVVNHSQWERPETYDETPKVEAQFIKAAEVLYTFYSQYNSEKLCDMNYILTAFKGNYTELFINLANKYNVQDLSMFSGVDFD